LLQQVENQPRTAPAWRDRYSLASLPGTHVANTSAMMAGSVLSAIPPVLVYLVFQRYLINGLTMGVDK
jgi:multiple sugar transport system permease protein